jgi:transposase
MWWRGEPKRIFAYGEPIDMRCSFDGLVAAVKGHLRSDPLSGDFFIFLNRRRTLLKGVFWDRTGWCVFAKRLERGRFELRRSDLQQELSSRELELLLDGVLRGCRSR